MENALFQLLRLGLGTSSLDGEDLTSLSRQSEKEWENLRDMASFQGVSGIVVDGISTIIDAKGKDFFNHFEGSFWRHFIVKWSVSVEQSYVAKNREQLSVINDISTLWKKQGIRMMVFKGEAMGTLYPNPLHRAPGDIDCYLFEDYTRGNELAKGFPADVDEGWYKHSQIHYRGQLIENHLFFVHTREGKSSKELNQVMVDTLKNVEFEMIRGTNALLPPPLFNALFLTYHALTHFLEEGMRMKQLIDWAVFLKKDADKIDWPVFYQVCDKYHLRRFAEVATDIAVNLLGVRVSDTNIITSSRFTPRVVHSTLYDKDYVFSSGKGGWTNRLHIITNLFKYRWKYHLIYNHSVMRQLWWYAIGYIWKTE